MKLKRFILLTLVALLAVPVGQTATVADDDDKSQSLQREIRRLHPERERAKALKKLQEQLSRKAEPKADPWDTSDEVWGTVDLPLVAVKDSTAVEGHRVTPPQQQHTSKTPEEQAALDALLGDDYSLVNYGFRRMTWQDEPVTRTVEQLTQDIVVNEEGDCLSRYVKLEPGNNEVFFRFKMPQQDDSVPGPLRLCVQYCADDPLDFDQLIFNVDGFDYPFYPSNPQRSQLSKDVYWETSDDVLTAPYKDLVYALTHGHWATVKLVSERGIHHVKLLTDGQRADFAATLDLYRLLGGKI